MVDPQYNGFQVGLIVFVLHAFQERVTNIRKGDKFEDLDDALKNPTDRRWLAVGQALIHENYTVGMFHESHHLRLL